MIGSITPLVQEAIVTKRWLSSVLAYAVGSVLASAFVGVVLGAIGGVVHPAVWGWIAVALTAVLIGAMEWGLIPKPPLLVKRQTKMGWRLAMGHARAAFWWGADIGNGLTTAANYHSFWLFCAAAFMV